MATPTTNNVGYDFTFANQVSTNGNGNAMGVGGLNYVTLDVTALSGAFTANLTPQIAGVATNGVPQWVGVPAVNLNTMGQVSVITAPGKYLIPTPGADQLQVAIANYSAGQITIQGKGSIMPPPVVIVAFQSAGTLGSVGQSAIWTDNIIQWGGTNVVTGGLAGSLGVGGLAANGTVMVGNAVPIAGQDASNNVQVPLINANKSQVVNGGNSDKPTYIMPFNVNAAAATDLATIESGSTKKTRLSRIVFTNVGCQTTAGLRNLQLIRTTTAGSGNVTTTPPPVDSGDAAFTGVTRSGATGSGLGTAGTVLANIPLWVPAAQAVMQPIIIPFGGDGLLDKRPLGVVGVANGLSLRDPGASGGTQMAGFVEFTEEAS